MAMGNGLWIGERTGVIAGEGSFAAKEIWRSVDGYSSRGEVRDILGRYPYHAVSSLTRMRLFPILTHQMELVFSRKTLRS